MSCVKAHRIKETLWFVGTSQLEGEGRTQMPTEMAESGCNYLCVLSIGPNTHPSSVAEDGFSTIVAFTGTSFLNCFLRIYQWFYMLSDSDTRLFVIV